MAGLRQTGGGSTLSAIPRPAGRLHPSNKGPFQRDRGSKCGTPEKPAPGRMLNLMFDPRVIRGPTLSAHKLLDSEVPAPVKKTHKVRPKRKNLDYANTPEPFQGRKNMDIQTEAYLEELSEDVSEYNVDTQTDPFLDRPPTPLFVPQKSGPDVGTQIEEGDLFNFDEEVEPMLEVLVGRTLEQALMEAMEERQLANLHAYQDHFEQIRAAELVATQRMEAAERRIVEEKKKRVQQEKIRLQEEQSIKEKIEAQEYAKSYLKKLTDSIYDTLQKANYFYDPVEREVEEIFLPCFKEDIMNEIAKISCARSTLNCLVESVVVSYEDRAQESARKIMNKIILQVESNVIGVSQTLSHEEIDDMIKKVESNSESAKEKTLSQMRRTSK